MVAVTGFELQPTNRTISLGRASAAAVDAAGVGRLDDAPGQHAEACTSSDEPKPGSPRVGERGWAPHSFRKDKGAQRTGDASRCDGAGNFASSSLLPIWPTAIWPCWRSTASRARSKHRGSNLHSGATDDPADVRAAPHYFTLIVIVLPLRVIGIDGLVLVITMQLRCLG